MLLLGDSLNSFLSEAPSGKGFLQAYQSLTDWVFSSLEIYKVCVVLWTVNNIEYHNNIRMN